MENKPVIILGAKGIGQAALEIFKSHRVEIFCFLDDDAEMKDKEIAEVTVLGKTTDDGFLKYIGLKCDAFVALDDNKERKYLVKLLNERRKVMPTNAIHADAIVSSSAFLGYGNFINAGVKIGAGAKVTNHCLIHTNAVVEHGAELGEYVQLGAGSIINAEAKIEDEVFIGSGVTVISGVTIGKGARVGAGSVVVADVKAGKTVFGNPAQEINK